jgi:hypothetical protein
MSRDDEEDLYDEEFDFVDDDDIDESEEEEDSSDLESEAAEAAEAPPRGRANSQRDNNQRDSDERENETGGEVGDRREPEEGEEPLDEYGRPEQPPANYVVHVYENKKFKRTIDRPFTPEDAEAFATEFNRTAKNYSRIAVTGKNDAKPKKALDEK